MAFADPQSVTIGSAISLPRVSSAPSSGGFRSNDANTNLVVNHSYGPKLTKHYISLKQRKIAPDPLISAQNIVYEMTVQLIVTVPLTGFTVPQQKEVVDALWGNLNATSGLNMTKLLGGEN